MKSNLIRQTGIHEIYPSRRERRKNVWKGEGPSVKPLVGEWTNLKADYSRPKMLVGNSLRLPVVVGSDTVLWRAEMLGGV